ncbi:MAG TPA: hemolysin family protein [Pirellulales bacterium]|nr:hemolysin family protein [Pirellulales bacterium]
MTLTLLIMVLMISINAMFAAYEIALASISVGRLKALADAHRKGAKAALLMKQSMEASLATLQLGITLVGAIAAATGGHGAAEDISPVLHDDWGVSEWVADVLAVTLVVIPLSAVTIVIGELIPKVFALKNKEWVCLKFSPPMRAFSRSVFPAVWVMEGSVKALLAWSERRWKPQVEGHKAEVTEIEELRAVVALARTSRLIGGQEEKIILGAARLSSRSIAEIMIPLRDVVTLAVNQTMAESLVLAHTDMHTRFPVCSRPGDPQSICGYVNFKDIVSELRLAPHQPSLRGIIRSLPDLKAELSIASSLQRMIHEHVHIALVRDAERVIVGLVTMEDILEELVGDIEDEYDRAPSHVSEGLAGWVMGGGVPLERFEQVTGARLDRRQLPAECRTLHDVIVAQLQRPPRGGDIVQLAGLRVLVRKLRRQRVLEAQVSRGQITAEEENADGDQGSAVRRQETEDRRPEKASGGR